MLEVHRLTKRFGGFTAVDQVSFQVNRGEILGLIGPNGSGKSTTFNLVNGQLAPDAGGVWLDGQSLLGLPPHALWHIGVSRTFQVAQTFASFTALQNVQMALLSAQGRSFNPWLRARAQLRVPNHLRSRRSSTARRPAIRSSAYGFIVRLPASEATTRIELVWTALQAAA